MDKMKITEIKSNVKIKVITKEEASKLERELESDAFPQNSSNTISSTESSEKSFVPLINQSEIVSQSEGEELVRPAPKVEDAPLFSESARYDTNNMRVDMSESRIKYESPTRPLESIDPSLVRSQSTSQQQGIGFRNDELERIQGHQKDYSAVIDAVRDIKAKNLRPWEV